MSILASLAAWRFIMGTGIGAEHPLSAVITAEQVYHSILIAPCLASQFLLWVFWEFNAFDLSLINLNRWAPTQARAQMMAAVSLMQPCRPAYCRSRKPISSHRL